MKISVCMATYNGEKYIKEQIDSILCQLSIDDELIISDDGSTDNTINIINLYDDDRIKLFHSDKKNLISNFENALYKARGDIIFLSDQDDIWTKNKVEICKKELEHNLLVFSNAQVFVSGDIKKSKKQLIKSDFINGTLSNIYKNKFVGATMAFNKSILKKALPFPKDIAMHDIWLGLIATSIGNTFFIDEPLIQYRRHDNNASNTGGSSDLSFKEKIRYRIILIYRLLLRLYLNK